jgi:dihydroxy-acid dehydratase
MANPPKSELPSRHVTEGTHNALHRVFYYAMGLDSNAIHQPFVGVVMAWDEIADPQNRMNEIAKNVSSGVWKGGGTPRQFATISGHRGAHGESYSLLGRELIADSVELTVRGHSYDGLVGIAATSSALAALAIAMCRLDIPSVVVPVVPENGPDRPVRNDVIAMANALTTLGFVVLPDEDKGESSQSAVRARFSGERVMARLQSGETPRESAQRIDVIAAAREAAVARANPEILLHILSIAQEAGITIDLEDLRQVVESVACSPEVSFREGDCGVTRVLTGNLAPAGSLATGTSRSIRVKGSAKVFESEFEAVQFIGADLWRDEVLVVRGQGPRGGNACTHLGAIARLLEAWVLPCRMVITDGILPRLGLHVGVSLVGPEPIDFGPLGLVQDGDLIEADLDAGSVELQVDPDILKLRTGEPPQLSDSDVGLWKLTTTIGRANAGALAHPGARNERTRYADL